MFGNNDDFLLASCCSRLKRNVISAISYTLSGISVSSDCNQPNIYAVMFVYTLTGAASMAFLIPV